MPHLQTPHLQMAVFQMEITVASEHCDTKKSKFDIQVRISIVLLTQRNMKAASCLALQSHSVNSQHAITSYIHFQL